MLYNLHSKIYFFITLLLLFVSCSTKRSFKTLSPNSSIEVNFSLDKDGKPSYSIKKSNTSIVKNGKLGFKLNNNLSFTENFEIVEVKNSSKDEIWEQVWGEKREIRNHYNEFNITLKKKDNGANRLQVSFRVFDDGVGFRYEIPRLINEDSIFVLSEETSFNFTDDHKAWYIPCHPHADYGLYYNTYERLYENNPISKLDTVHTPITFETNSGLYLSIHEAALTDYAAMTLIQQDSFSLNCNLVPWPDGIKVRTGSSLKTPWRTIQIAEKPGDLITSYLVLNLNEPNKIKDPSWIKPMKYVGIWWEMHVGKSTWFKGDKHGATTENTKRHIDFASKHNIGGVLVEGWNTGWESWESWLGHTPSFDFITPYSDFQLEELVKYAKERNVHLISHHETSADVLNYEKHLEKAFQQLEDLGVHAVKTGYVGPINPKGQHHHGQWMVNHYRKALETAARHKVMVDVHEPIKPTGIRRTYPNMMTREGVRGMEYNAWSEGNPPDHTTILPFTRMLAGPIDYTPGIFDITFNKYKKDNRVYSTLANQLALYVVIYSPMQMAADLIENYEDKIPFKFIEEVPTDWEDTKVIDSKIGDYIIVARKERGGKNWFLGAITDEEARTFTINLGFLDSKKQYQAEIYQDGNDAHWEINPFPVEVQLRKIVKPESEKLSLKLAAGGGCAIIFKEI